MVSGTAKIPASINLARHLRQVTTPDHNLLDYYLCVVTAHALCNYWHIYWSEPVWLVVYTCTLIEKKTEILTCHTHGAKPTRKDKLLSLSWNDCLGNTFHCSFLQVFYLAVSLSQISHERNIDYLDATKLSGPEQKAGKMLFWRLMLQRAPQAWSSRLLDPKAWEQTSSPRSILMFI